MLPVAIVGYGYTSYIVVTSHTMNRTHVAEEFLQLSAVVCSGVDLLSSAAQDTSDLGHVLLPTD